MYKNFILCCIIMTAIISGKAQSGSWTSWESLHKDSKITVEVQFYIPANNICQSNGRRIRYKYRVKGSYWNAPYYLNWKLNYFDCNGDLFYQTYSLEIGKSAPEDISNWISVESMDYEIDAASLETRHYDAVASSSSRNDAGKIAAKTSRDPDKIGGAQKIYMNQTLELNVVGGSLGVGAEWIWYQDSCGGRRLGKGKSLRIAPTDKVKIFVRGEGTNNSTKCIFATIDVDKSSLAPTSIAGETKLCKGSSTTLSVQGGALGLGASWVWYEGTCGGKRLGTGSSISVTPAQNTQYYVRAEGSLNTSTCTNIMVAVYSKSTDPSSISVANATVCEGNSLTLRVNGGKLAGDGQWVWYEGNCGRSPIGTGESKVVNPQRNTTYYVRAEGACNTQANCVALPITVIPKLPALTRIVAPTQVARNEKTTLSIPTWNGPTGSRIEWYEGDCSRGKLLGYGPSIVVRPKSSNTTYYAKGKGTCGTTSCLQTTITAVKQSHKVCTDQSFTNFGWGLGLDYRGFEASTQRTGFQGSYPLEIQGGGLSGELRFAPIFKDFFSLGVRIGGALGTTPYLTSGRTVLDGTLKEKYFYMRWNYGAEFAVGAKPLKLIGTINRYQQSNDYNGTLNKDSFDEAKITFKGPQRWETVGAGLRFGRYTKSQADVVDLIYTFSKEADIEQIGAVLQDIPNSIQGISLNYWKHNKYKISADFRLPSAYNSWTDFEFNQSTLQISLIFGPDRFY